MSDEHPPEHESPAEPPHAHDSAAEAPVAHESAAERVEAQARRALHEVIHAWIPLGIVLVSVLAALMGWRASLADETSNRSEELSRQDLVQQQQLIVRDNQAVDTDIRTFSQFAQSSELAHSERDDSGQVAGDAHGQLLTDAQANLGIARYLGKQVNYQNYVFDPTNATGNPALLADGTYSPGHPYKADSALENAENQDAELHGLAPEQLHAQAETQKLKAVRFEGVAALFVAVMVLLTVGALITGPPKVWITGGGATIAAAGVILFILVQAS